MALTHTHTHTHSDFFECRQRRHTTRRITFLQPSQRQTPRRLQQQLVNRLRWLSAAKPTVVVIADILNASYIAFLNISIGFLLSNVPRVRVFAFSTFTSRNVSIAPSMSGTHSHLATFRPSVDFLKLTASSKSSAPPSGSLKCLATGWHCALEIDLLTYLLIYVMCRCYELCGFEFLVGSHLQSCCADHPYWILNYWCYLIINILLIIVNPQYDWMLPLLACLLLSTSL